MTQSDSVPDPATGADQIAGTALPTSFRVGVLMERRDRPDSRWLRESWDLLGVVLDSPAGTEPSCRCVRRSEQGEQYLWSGFDVRLHRDELESYYHNLLASEPRIFVITHTGENGRPEPFIVSLSYDEANAYETGGEVVYSAALPPVLYAWVEQYVLVNYAPERRIKRKRDRHGDAGACDSGVCE